MRCRLLFIILVVFCLVVNTPFALDGQEIGSRQAIEHVVTEFKNQLNLSEQQTTELANLLETQVENAMPAIEAMDEMSFDSVLDLLLVARETKEQFGPSFSKILTVEQMEKLKKLPRAKDLYFSAVSGWLTEARLKKLNTRLNLSEEQVQACRDILRANIGEAINLLGLLTSEREGENKPAVKSMIMDTLLDLRLIQKQARRSIEKILTSEQLDIWKAER